MELIKLIEHLRTITSSIDDFNLQEIIIHKCGKESDKWECSIEVRWDLQTLNIFANLGYNFTMYEMGLVGEHNNSFFYGINIFIK